MAIQLKPQLKQADTTRMRILQQGRRLVARSGLRGLTVRGVAAQANINLGTFVYHFGTREAFIHELMEDWYGPLYAKLSLTVDEHLAPVEKIRLFLLRLGEFLLENRAFVRHVIMDAANEEAAALRFVKSLFGRHPQLLFKLIREAQAAGELPQEEPMKLGVYLFGAALFPSVWMGVLLPDAIMPKKVRSQVQRTVIVTEEIERRLAWALSGLNRDLNTDSVNKLKRTKTKQHKLKQKSSESRS